MRTLRFWSIVLVVAAMAGMQALFFHLHIPEVEPSSYLSEAVDLKITPQWRYGYVQLWHGAVLVKAPNGEVLKSSSPENTPEAADDIISAIMRRELEALPVKAVLETCLYLAILAYVFFGWGWLNRILLAKKHHRGRLLMVQVLGWLVLWLIASAPLLLWGYGTPLFTNCLGPGALSSSGIYLGRAPAYSSTISYRYLLTAMAPLCLTLLAPISFAAPWLPGITEGQVLWLGGLLFFLGLGLMRAFTRD